MIMWSLLKEVRVSDLSSAVEMFNHRLKREKVCVCTETGERVCVQRDCFMTVVKFYYGLGTDRKSVV